MATRKMFTANGNTINMGKGNLQFNTSTPEFRNKVQLMADGINKMNDEQLKYREKAQTTRSYLDTYLKGTYVAESRVKELEKEILDYTEAMAEIRKEILDAMPTYDEVDKNLYYAYRTFVLGEEDASSGNTYKRAFMEWLDANGVTPTEKGITFIMSQMGVKKASAKAMCKNGGKVFTTAMSEKQYLDLVYRTVATLMYKANILKEFTYEYVIDDKKIAR